LNDVVRGPSLFDAARRCLAATDVGEKLALTQATTAAFLAGELEIAAGAPVEPIGIPGRPSRPRLVDPRALAGRGLGTETGRAALAHAVAHIEFNAINLAWDAVWRFRDMPEDYYRDWVRIAGDEARHFGLVAARLARMDHAYGDFDGHDGLWDMAVKTADSCLARMALVPRVLEARGLDVTPGMIARLRRVGDLETVATLEVILAEEVAHVAAGSHWFRHCCALAGLEPEATFRALIARHLGTPLKGPFNAQARLRAGFSVRELEQLGMAAAGGAA
jgi:uncharacterized ferritin-like protein (DUF455 family)